MLHHGQPTGNAPLVSFPAGNQLETAIKALLPRLRSPTETLENLKAGFPVFPNL